MGRGIPRWPQGAAPGQEGQVGLDRLVGVDGLVSHGHVQVLVAGDDLGDVRGQAAHDGVGDEDPPEVVGAVVQRAAVGMVGQAGAGQAALSMFRMVLSQSLRLSAPNRRWNSNGAGPIHRHSRRSYARTRALFRRRRGSGG